MSSEELRNIDQEKEHALTLLQRIEQEAKECAAKLDIPKQDGYDVLAVLHEQTLFPAHEYEQKVEEDEYDDAIIKRYVKLFAQYIITSAKKEERKEWDMIKEILMRGYDYIEENYTFDEASFQAWILQAARPVIQNRTLRNDEDERRGALENTDLQVSAKVSASKKDFFISYSRNDDAWARWISYQLEQKGYTCVLQKWDFRAGGNFVLDMQDAAINTQRTIAVLSPDYLTEYYTQTKWATAFFLDPIGKDRKLIPIRVRDCKPGGTLAAIGYIDLVGRDEQDALDKLLREIAPTRVKPVSPPPFPGTARSSEKPIIDVFFSYAHKDEALRQQFHDLLEAAATGKCYCELA